METENGSTLIQVNLLNFFEDSESLSFKAVTPPPPRHANLFANLMEAYLGRFQRMA